jgi:hypothetical protein
MAKQKEVKWTKKKICYTYRGKHHSYAYSVEQKSFLIAQSEWDTGCFFRVKDFTTAKQIVELLEK